MYIYIYMEMHGVCDEDNTDSWTCPAPWRLERIKMCIYVYMYIHIEGGYIYIM